MSSAEELDFSSLMWLYWPAFEDWRLFKLNFDRRPYIIFNICKLKLEHFNQTKLIDSVNSNQLSIQNQQIYKNIQIFFLISASKEAKPCISFCLDLMFENFKYCMYKDA
jgi:hypothetical protein